MKIVHLLGWYFPDSVGGTEVYVEGLCKRLQDAGHEVLIAAPEWLAPGGLVLVETGTPQLAATQALVTAAGLRVQTWTAPSYGALVVGGSRA